MGQSGSQGANSGGGGTGEVEQRPEAWCARRCTVQCERGCVDALTFMEATSLNWTFSDDFESSRSGRPSTREGEGGSREEG